METSLSGGITGNVTEAAFTLFIYFVMFYEPILEAYLYVNVGQ